MIKISISNLPILGDLFSFRNLNTRKLQLNDDKLLTLQSLIDDNMTKINTTNDIGESNINFGECQKKLRKYYNIPDDVSLTLIKLDYRKEDSKISQIEYEIFNPKNRSEKLDLSICADEKIEVINPIDITSNKINNLIKSDNNFNFTDFSESLYKDKCSKFTSEDGAYVLTQDRILDYNYENEYCQKGCTLKEINATSGNAICRCPTNNGFRNISLDSYEEEIVNIESQLGKDKYKNNRYSATNIKALKCLKNIFDSGFVKNYIFIIFTLLLVIYLALFAYNLISYNTIRAQDYNINKIAKQKNSKKEKIKESVKVKPEEKDANTDKELTNKTKKINKDTNEDDEGLSFEKARKRYENKSFAEIIKKCLFEREIIISLITKKDIKIKALILVLSLINYLAVNTFFFSEKNIHQIYLDKNEYNASYQFKFIISSLFISFIFISISKFFYLKRKGTFQLKKGKPIAIIVGALFSTLFVFYWLYIGAVTSLYINIKKHLIVNTILCFIFSIIFDGLLSFISATLLYVATHNGKEKIYKIRKFMEEYIN